MLLVENHSSSEQLHGRTMISIIVFVASNMIKQDSAACE